MATNRIDILDPALLRPGRIDRKIEFPPPNEEARLDILRIHSRKMNLTRGINLRKIAELMPGASGAEVKVSYGKLQEGKNGYIQFVLEKLQNLLNELSAYLV